ncbi:MAG TPA: TIGR03557 family F420-dependent LLM class oxidoreductase [Solirubrobacteraceae bacterium]|jgi:G6PDH family F420-dependent oxidoreductase|nr:TIGR03557 family F420-dependent LLM class oxidoreductase [Solirubrobacteraceae bacterium]
MRIGYFLSSEEWGPRELISQAVRAKEAGFDGLWISDHFHPWNDEQGHSPFVWSTIGAISQAAPGMQVTTAVTCPTIRIHPAIIAQAAASAAVMLDGRFCLGVGSGEALNEHVIGARWPEADERLEMLEEAVDVIRTLWDGGVHDHRGRHYRVEHARIYDLPVEPPRIIVSGFGSKAVQLAARIGDGYCTVGPDADSVKTFRAKAQSGALVQGGLKVCWSDDKASARRTVHRLWPNEALPGELAQVLPTPEHFEQAAELVTEEMVAADVPCGPDVDEHVEAIRAYEEAGFDELYVNQIGPEQDAFFAAYRDQVLPRVRE